MKHRMLISAALLAVVSLAAFGFINKENKKIEKPVHKNKGLCDSYFNDLMSFDDQNVVDFAYDVNNRFFSSITKEQLDQALSVTDIFIRDDSELIESYFNITISTFQEQRSHEVFQKGESEVLTDAQLQLLQSLDYGDGFYITGNIKKRISENGKTYVDTLVNYLTLIPAHPAAYTMGKEVLIDYLKANSIESTVIARKGQLQPGKISFKVHTDGTIGDVQLTATSGYDSIDKKMLELVEQMPGIWEVATNAQGEKVEHKLVFFFGQLGC